MHITSDFSFDQQFTLQNKRQRILSAAVVLLASLVFFTQFKFPVKLSTQAASENSATLLFFKLPEKLNQQASNPERRDTVGERASLQEKPAKLSITTKNQPDRKAIEASQQTAITLVSPEIKPQSEADLFSNLPAKTSEKPSNQTSNSLNLDKKAIMSAYNESKTEIQKMAEKSGVNPNSQHLSQSDRLQSALSKAAKPDCIGKETAGAGLLAIPLIAYMSLTDHCK